MDEMIKITKPTGVEDTYKVLSAFKANGMDFVVLDSKLKDPNGNTITFIAQIDGEELKYIEGETWDLVRNTLITIVKGLDSDYKHKVNFEFIKVGNEYKASENVGHTLGLKDAHISSIVDQYKAFANNEVVSETVEPEIQVTEEAPVVEQAEGVQPEVPVVPEESAVTPEVASTEEVVAEEVNEQASPLDQSIVNANTAEIDIAAIAEAANNVDSNETVETSIETNAEPVSAEPIVEEAPVMENVIEANPDLVTNVENPVNATPINEEVIEPVPTAAPIPMDIPVGDVQAATEPVVDEVQPIAENVSAAVISEPQVAEEPIQEQPVENVPTEVAPVAEVNVSAEPVNGDSNYKEKLEDIRRQFNLVIDEAIKEIDEKQQTVDAQLYVAGEAYKNAQNVMNTPQPSNEDVISIQDYKPEEGPVLQKVA